MAKKNTHASKALQEARAASRKQLAADVARMSKTANQRLREIEKRGLEKASNAYRYVETLAFDKEHHDSAIATDSKQRMKWNTNTRRMTYQQLVHEKTELERFLYHSKTSTVSGIKKMYSEGYNKFKERTNSNISFEDYADMWKMSNLKAAFKAYGSSEIQKRIAQAMDSNVTLDDINNLLAESLDNDYTLSEFTEKLESQISSDTSFFEFHDSEDDEEWPFGSNI